METIPLRVRLFGGVLIMALLISAFPNNKAEAATVSELQAQIQVLMAQVALLQQQLVAQRGTTCPSFTTDLWVGSNGSEVTKLQNYLISKGFAIPAGATGYFGEQTRSALAKFQSTNGLAPASGIFGPLTKAKIASLCTTTPVVTTPTTPNTPTTPSDSNKVLTGEAEFERFKASDGDDTDLEEGDKNAEVMQVTFRTRFGDARLQRIEIGVEADVANDETDPWDTFDRLAVYHNGKSIGSVDASQKKNWQEDRPQSGQYTIRISNLTELLKADEEVDLEVKASLQKSIKGTLNGELWNIFIPNDGIRGIDADNVVVTTGDAADSTTLNIDQAGSSDEIIVRRSDDDPDARSLRLEENKNSDWHTVFVFDLDTDDSRNDIEVRTLPFDVTLSSGNLSEMVRAARVVVDGTTYTDETIVDGTPGQITFTFDSDELVINNGDRVPVALELQFKALPPAYESAQITTSMQSDNIYARGNDRLTVEQLAGSAMSETHTLITHGLDVATPSVASAVVSSVKGDNNDYITFTLSMPITAYNQGVYIPTDGSSISYTLVNANGDTLAGLGDIYVSSDARKQNGYFYISKGSTRNVTLEVTYIPGMSTYARLQLQSIGFGPTEAAPTQTWLAEPQDTFQTAIKNVLY